MLPAEETVIVRPYGDDDDDVVLAEVRPRWIVMYDPNLDFLRRIEVRRCLGMYSSVPKIVERYFESGLPKLEPRLGGARVLSPPSGNE